MSSPHARLVFTRRIGLLSRLASIDWRTIYGVSIGIYLVVVV
jgi:hypothetical protein